MDKHLQDLCRLCGEERKCSFNVFIKSEDDIILSDVIKDSLNITISEEDTIPTSICSLCNTHLLHFIKFRDVAKKTQLFLVDLEINMEKEIAERRDSLSSVNCKASVTPASPLPESADHHSFSSDDDNIPLNEAAEKSSTQKQTKVQKRLKRNGKQEKANYEKESEQALKRAAKPMDCDHYESSVELSIESPLDKPEQCNICEKRFTKEQYLKQHLRMTHKIVAEEKYECKRCNQKFKQKESYEQHIRQHDADKRERCDTCGKTYLHQQSLRSHIRTIHMYDGKPKFVCEECGAAFKKFTSLRFHKMSHTGEKPFECLQCGRRFLKKGNLMIHMDTHSETSYICTVCKKKLATLRGLRQHMVSHSDCKPHKCPVCPKAFNQVTSLKTHLIMHSGIRPYSCNFCGRTFTGSQNRRIHMKQVHKKEFAEMEASGMKLTPNKLPKLRQLREEFIR